MKTIYNINIVLLVLFVFIGCSKKEEIPADVKVNNFVWKGLNAYYLWQGKVPDLSDRRFSTQSQINNYLSNFQNPSKLFYSLLYQKGTIDKFSWIVDDYIALEKSFQGITLNNGMNFGLVQYQDKSENVFGYVRYVVPNSDAASKNVERGMIFNQIDNTNITTSNYKELIKKKNYTITLANYNNGNPTKTNQKIALTKNDLQENPIFISKIIESENKKIGYLMYNQFSSSYDEKLNTEFAKFKSNGVTELIVDLRYNGGGSVNTAVYLGSMITGQFTNELFAKQVWNEKYMDIHGNNKNLKDFFTDKIVKKGRQQPINSLNLKDVYFIVSNSSASASELVINALKPYINVKLVGDITYGKHVGSITLYDSKNYRKNGPEFNKNHTWAMQPIVLKIQNKRGETNPNGHNPDVFLKEKYEHLGVLGNVNEPLLKKTINLINGKVKSSVKMRKQTSEFNELMSSDELNPNSNNMYVNFK